MADLGDPSIQMQEETLNKLEVNGEIETYEEEEDDLELDFSTIEEDLKEFQKDEVVQDSLSKGVDLRQYVRQINADLLTLELSSIPEYIAVAPKVASLFEQMNDCDKVLESMQNILQGFQQDLGGISDEIKSLQEQSIAMNIKLKNRKSVESVLNGYLQYLVVPDALIVGICQGAVNENYLVYLQQLDSKIAFVRSNDGAAALKLQSDSKNVSEESVDLESSKLIAPSETAAAQDVEPLLEQLRLKAVAKVRSFLLAQMEQLKKPQTNVQILQQNSLIKYSYFVTFLTTHAPAVAEEIRATYVDTMSRILHALFKSYQAQLARLQVPERRKDDTVAIEHNKVAGSVANTSKEMSLADREKLLGEPDSPPIVIHLAQKQGKKYPFEALHRSVQKHLMDSATSEFMFTLDFFGENRHLEIFNQIFVKTLSLCLEFLEQHLHRSHDIVTLLLLIRTNLAQQRIMERRKVPCLQGYLHRVNLQLWPYYKRVFDTNLESIRRLSVGPAGVSQLGPISIQVHYMSLRYARFSSQVYALSTSLSTSDEGIPKSLEMLRMAFLTLLNSLAESQQGQKAHCVFLMNNYDAILSYFNEASHACSPVDSEEFEQLKRSEMAKFVELQLGECYGDVIQYVKQSGEQDGSIMAENDVEKLVNDFSRTWRSGLELIHTQLMGYFVRTENGLQVLQMVVAQLLLYFTRFQELVKTKHPACNKGMLSYQEIREEIRQYVRQF